jgi:hypothetical protein
MKNIFLFVVVLFWGLSAIAQKSEDSVKMVVNKMFTSMKSSDAKGLAECFADSAVLQTVVKNKEGVVSVRNERIGSFINQLSKIAQGDADERIKFDIVKVDADLAVAWTPYQFYYKGNFSHCGVNSFQLVRLNNAWKIQYIIDTRRKDNCIN